jgi:tetratricopeptide (TPR) repeat protein
VVALRVFISSPGDVMQERAVARRVLGRVQGAYAGRLKLDPVLWEQQPLLATDTFQAQIVRPADTDIVIGILWNRFGTPLPTSIQRPDGSAYQSGTEFEIEDALLAARSRGAPRVLIYRKTAAPEHWFASAREAIDAAAQCEALDAFLDRLLRNDADGSFAGAFHNFRSTADFEEILELHLHRLLREIEPELAADALPAPASWTFGSPFRGLKSFEFEHAPVFFGRTAATTAAVEHLLENARRGTAFLLLLGRSGGGKSSLAMAGVLPMLMQPEVVAGVDAWRCAVLRPGDGHGDLLLALTAALASPAALPGMGRAAELATRARAEPEAFAALVIAQLDRPDAPDRRAHLALVVDQLEEMFSDPQVSAAERQCFVALLDRLARSGRVWIIATLRSDFYPQCAELPVLVELKSGAGQYDVLPPESFEIAQMIRLPAATAGLRFEQDAESGVRLDERLRDAMVERSAALPLLEFTLEELYQRRTAEGVLTADAFHAMGGLEGAIAHRAEQVYNSQPELVQQALPEVLDALVAVGEDDEATARRRTRLSAFGSTPASQLVHALIDARLLVGDLDSDGESHVSVAHEALLRHWPRVVEWLAANRELLRIRARVGAAAERWQREARRPDYLLASGKPMAEAALLRQSGMQLDAVECEFIAVSQRRVRRNRSLRRGAVAALALLSVLASAAAFVAFKQTGVARREATTAGRTSEFLSSLFAIADPTEDRGSKVTARELLDRGAAKIRTELRDEPLVRAELLNTMGRAYSGLGLYEPALRLTAESLNARQRRLGRDHPDTLRSQEALATVLYLSGDYGKAESAFRAAADSAARIYPGGHIDRTRAALGLADVLTAAGHPSAAEPIYQSALADLHKLHLENSRDQVAALSGLAGALYFQSRLPEAEAAFRRTLDLGTRVLGPDHPKVAETINNLGSLAYQQGDYERARNLWNQALPQYRSIYGPSHPEVASVLNNLARVAVIERQFVQAERLLDEALAIDRRYKDGGHDDLILPLNSLGLTHMGLARYDAATDDFAAALNIARQHDHWMRGVVLSNQADLLLRQGEVGEAAETAAAARAALQQDFPPDTRADEGWRFALLDGIDGAVLDAQGQHERAQPLLDGSVRAMVQRFGESSLFAVDAMNRAEHNFAAAGNASEARRMRQRIEAALRQVAAPQERANR